MRGCHVRPDENSADRQQMPRNRIKQTADEGVAWAPDAVESLVGVDSSAVSSTIFPQRAAILHVEGIVKVIARRNQITGMFSSTSARAMIQL